MSGSRSNKEAQSKRKRTPSPPAYSDAEMAVLQRAAELTPWAAEKALSFVEMFCSYDRTAIATYLSAECAEDCVLSLVSAQPCALLPLANHWEIHSISAIESFLNVLTFSVPDGLLSLSPAAPEPHFNVRVTSLLPNSDALTLSAPVLYCGTKTCLTDALIIEPMHGDLPLCAESSSQKREQALRQCVSSTDSVQSLSLCGLTLTHSPSLDAQDAAENILALPIELPTEVHRRCCLDDLKVFKSSPAARFARGCPLPVPLSFSLAARFEMLVEIEGAVKLVRLVFD